MERDFPTGWTAVNTGKSSGWFAGRSFRCKNVGQCSASTFLIVEMYPGMPSDSGILAGCRNIVYTIKDT